LTRDSGIDRPRKNRLQSAVCRGLIPRFHFHPRGCTHSKWHFSCQTLKKQYYITIRYQGPTSDAWRWSCQVTELIDSSTSACAASALQFPFIAVCKVRGSRSRQTSRQALHLRELWHVAHSGHARLHVMCILFSSLLLASMHYSSLFSVFISIF